MIKIKVANIGEIEEAFFNGINSNLVNKIDFYELAFEVISGNRDAADLITFNAIHGNTKTAMLKKFLLNKSLIAGKNDYHLITIQANLKPHVFINRASYLTMLGDLKQGNNLKTLILNSPTGLLALEAQYTFAGIDNSIVNKIFSYGSFQTKKTTLIDEEEENQDTDGYDAYTLTDALGIDVCPYCNRGYISTIVSEKGKKICRPTFDHFFDHASHPFLALSFYNLIPSCTICNSTLKGTKHFELNTHIHPYLEGFENDVEFDYWFKGLRPDKKHPANFEIVIRTKIPELSPKYRQLEGSPASEDEGNIKVFKLREIYQSHADIVGEIHTKLDRNSPYYAISILNFIKALNTNKEDFYRFYFGNYLNEKDFNKRPLSKLTKDIVKKRFPELV
ncbi:MAG TPA: hypothetical protein VHB48_11900 [Chitinophagaceae bacterium]|nr:hypothetical protein [Chitinophagaceae bacterium]